MIGDETAQLRWLTVDEVRAAMDETYAVRALDAYVVAVLGMTTG
jgi:hypothetical protein